MKIHEYQAKELFSRAGIPVPRGNVARNGAEARRIAAGLGGARWVVKAQVHAGGRGKGGGIRTAETLEGVAEAAQKMLGARLVTPQTGSEGLGVRAVLVEEALAVQRQFYVGIGIDRAKRRPVVMVSGEGGVDVEGAALRRPGSVLKAWISPGYGLQGFQARALLFGVQMESALVPSGALLLQRLYRLFEANDCQVAEINPLAATKERGLVALDAKVEFDDSALFRHQVRHQALPALADEADKDPLEAEASRLGLNYVRMKGDMAIMVNGAGLAMATMDLIEQAGARPANFLDVGGGATAEMVTKGFRILLKDPQVKGILINIFGGILRCDVLAKGVVEGAAGADVRVPIIVRLDGTNVEEGRRILRDAPFDFTVAESLADASEKITGLAAILKDL